ncbi:MAG: RsfS/YbeB/iojap family protein [Brevinema sp.]
MDKNLQQIAELLTEECKRLTMTDIAVYDVEGKSPLTDMAFLATAEHILQLNAARNTLSLIGKQNGLPLRNPTEDYSEGWLALDHGDYVVHILIPEKRAFYRLDDLMKGIHASRAKEEDLIDAEEVEIENELPELSPAELLRLNSEFDFLNEEELPPSTAKPKKN